jgi:DNA primase|tara:strand:+ start:978 stop:1925 length:948 start_codon:yes stop_codon:yes gene_type:complete
MASSGNFSALKARVRISDFVRPFVKLTRDGDEWVGCCPFHEENTGSFKVNDKKQIYHCFGCGAHGDVFDFLEKAGRMSRKDAVERVRSDVGDVVDAAPAYHPPRVEQQNDEVLRKKRAAIELWNQAKPIAGTLAETYLRDARCIGIPLPSSLRFLPNLQPDGRNSDRFPTMIAGVTDLNGDICAVQRTFLRPDGLGKAPIKSPKMSLGPIGQGAVRLGDFGPIIGIAEGVETGLSAMELYQVPSMVVLGSRLSKLILPKSVGKVVIFADRGHAGERAAEEARAEYRRQGRAVVVRFSEVGDDFNDELRARRRGAK